MGKRDILLTNSKKAYRRGNGCTMQKCILIPMVLVLFSPFISRLACGESVAAPGSGPQQLANRQPRRSLHQFQGADGTMTFTNRPEKYKHRDDYVEIVIKYERISLPPKYTPTPREIPKAITDTSLRSIVRHYAAHYGLSESLVYAVIRAESNFNPNAVSRAGARGLMQLMPGTAAEMGVTDIFDPAQNIAGGTQYLFKMHELFGNNKQLALAAYNAGPENVKKHKGIPPFKETQDYVKAVLQFEEAYNNGRTAPALTVLSSPIPSLRTAAAQQNQKPVSGVYTVHFHSGLTQPADNVVDRDPYWYVEYGNRTYPVRKDLVRSVEKKG